jgi:hypothetical protein
MDEFNKPLSKNDLLAFEKLKLKWKELSVEVHKLTITLPLD